MAEAAATFPPTRQPDELAERVLRRAQVSKMTRALQGQLALANLKICNGWEHMSLDVIEPQVEEQLRRKRPASSNETISDSLSTTSSRLHSSGGPCSSPLTVPMFSDDFSPSKKRLRPADVQRFAVSGMSSGGRRTRFKPSSNATWKRSNNLPESSPIRPMSGHGRFPSNQISLVSFASDVSTIPDGSPSPELSEDDDADLPVHSFSLNASTRITSSPPRTPPPDRRMRKAHNVSWSRTPKNDGEGADLLLYLANSPIAGGHGAKTPVQAPKTPPSKSTPLPSSHMTPGMSGAGFLGFVPTTPGANFNFADFVNVTPSPAQGPWSRTPLTSRTPGAVREARRKLNFDHLVPPSTSPVLSRSNRTDGLGMELGGELITS